MEILEKIAASSGPKQKTELLGELFPDDFCLAVRLIFSGNSKRNIPPLFSRKKKSLPKAFWKSELPAKYGWPIVYKSTSASEFWEAYFRQSQVCDEFVSTGFENNPELMLKGLRWYGGFLNDHHWKSYRPFLEEMNDEQSRDFLVGAEFFRDLQVRQKDSLKKFSWEIQNTSIAEIVCSFVLLSEQVYFSTPTDADFLAKRPTLLSLLEDVLNEKLNGPRNDPPKWPNEKEIAEEFIHLVKCLYDGGEPKLYPLLREFDQRAQAKYLLQMFQWHGWVVDFSGDIPVVCPSSAAWKADWEKTEAKYLVFHDYYHGFDQEDAQAAERLAAASPNEISKEVVRRLYFGLRFLGDELGLDDKVKVQDGNVDIVKALGILNQFSGCYEAQYQFAMAEQKRMGVDVVSAIMNVVMGAGGQPRFPLEMRSIHQIVEIANKREGDVSLDEVKSTFELGSANLTQIPVRLDGQSFLKTPAGYFLLMRYFHPDVKTMLFNAIVRQNLKGNKIYSSFQEKKLAEIFQLGGWKAVCSKRLRCLDGRSSEIDVLAYKDGVLFVIETKLTYFRTSIREIHDHLPQLEKAGLQLKRATTAVKDNYAEIKNWLDFDETFENLRIIPLIVSSSFEYDHQLFNGFRKVSLFELQLLLQGTTPVLKGWLKLKEKALESLSPDYYDKVVTGYASDADWNAVKITMSDLSIEEDVDKIIQDGRMNCVSREASADEIAHAIESGEVWNILLQNEMPESEELVSLTIGGKVVANFAD